MKFDADDLYMPNYTRDMVNSLERFGADVVFKKSKFRYFEGSDTLFLIQPDWIHRAGTFGDVSGGSAFCARRATLDLIPFDDRLETSEDIAFSCQCFAHGLKAVFVDPFNHVLRRSVDKSRHTWRADHLLMPIYDANPLLIGEGILRNVVEI